jgi:hypothetical protein
MRSVRPLPQRPAEQGKLRHDRGSQPEVAGLQQPSDIRWKSAVQAVSDLACGHGSCTIVNVLPRRILRVA